ncbi:transposase [Streptomyces tanashiensis]|uniref:transposase n=1 Tax=Streptomyces tanashiensis TaxID=67367 RepID=UPI0034352F18
MTARRRPGRKRHMVTDTLCLLLDVAVTAANVGDRDAAGGLLIRLRALCTASSPSCGPTAATPAAVSAGAGTSSL